METREEQSWIDEQHAAVIQYLARASVEHGEVGDWPAWHVYPYVAIWAVESGLRPGWVGWWVISGDLPTDYTPCRPERHPRTGLKDIAERWRESAPLLAQGKAPSGWSIGAPEDWPRLAPLLVSRAEMLLTWADDDDLWQE